MLVVQPQLSPPPPASNSLPSSPRGSVVHENTIPSALTRKDSNDNVYSSTNHNGEVEEEEQDNGIYSV